MQQRLKERLVGAAVLVVIAVVFIPMFLTGPIDSNGIKTTNIPERSIEKFNSKLVPLTDATLPVVKPDMDNTPAEGQLFADEKKTDITPKASPTKTKSQTTNVVKQPVKDKKVGLTAWVVQLGSFTSKVNADKLNLTLKKSGFPAFVEPLEQDGETVYRVRVGPELLRADADVLLKKIKASAKLDGIVLSYP